MTISQWSNLIKVIPVDTGVVLPLDRFNLSMPTQLTSVMLYMYKTGSLGGSETAQLKLYGNSDLTAVVASSNVFTMSAAPNISSANWIGWVRFDFGDVPLGTDGPGYYLGLTLANYTRNGNTFYIAARVDYPDAFNRPAYGPDNPPTKFRLLGKR